MRQRDRDRERRHVDGEGPTRFIGGTESSRQICQRKAHTGCGPRLRRAGQRQRSSGGSATDPMLRGITKGKQPNVIRLCHRSTLRGSPGGHLWQRNCRFAFRAPKQNAEDRDDVQSCIESFRSKRALFWEDFGRGDSYCQVASIAGRQDLCDAAATFARSQSSLNSALTLRNV